LTSLLDRVRDGDGGFVAITGEPGIGKTTLLEWMAQAAAPLVVSRAAGRESEADLPFVAIADLLRPFQELTGGLPAGQAAALEAALALSAPRPRDRGSVNAASITLLNDAARESPLLILIDDYHWLDSASRDVIDFLSRRTRGCRYGMAVTTRGPLPEDHDGLVISLDPLDSEVAAVVVSRRGPTSQESIQRIVTLAAGNPLALVELPLDLPPVGHSKSRGETLTVSRSIERAYRSRLSGLPAETITALLALSVEATGTRLSLARLLTLLDLDKGSLGPAIAAGLVVDGGATIHFRHPLLRSVVQQMVAPEELRQVHLAAASATEDGDQRAWHLASGSEGPDDEVAKALEEAAGRALSRGAAASAASALERSAELSSDPDESRRRLVAAARAAHRAGDLVRTERLLGTARTSPDTAHSDPGLLLLDADLRMRRGDFAGAYGILRLEGATLAGRDPVRAATMLLIAAKMRVYRFEAAEALREVEEAVALVPRDQWDLVHLTSLGMVRTMAGHPLARESVMEAMTAAHAAPHGHTHTLGIGWPLLWLEDYEKARAFITRSIASQREGGHLAFLPQALLALGELNYRTGDWSAARDNANEALTLFLEGRQPTEAAIASALLARLDACVGDESAARIHSAAAAKSDVGSGLRAATAHAEAGLGLLALGLGNHLEAIAHFREARLLLVTGGVEEPWLLPLDADLAEALVRVGEREEGMALADDLITRGRSLDRRSAIAAGLRVRGLVEEDFGSLYQEAVGLHEHLPTPFELARTELCWGERLRRTRQRVEARSHLGRALSIFEQLGAAPWVARARSELNASGQTLQNGSTTTLTRQERQVAELVGAGATNRETADVLFLSTKTIEFHLANVYRKLGVRSRTEMAHKLKQA
jgi:DNA-binding CsgD family transcriptional regulator/energy-coupling factor transporter ATP-binding protein EcfA2